MKNKSSKNQRNIEMTSISIPANDSFHSLSNTDSSPVPSLKISNISNKSTEVITNITKVSEWFDTDGHRVFMKSVQSGDIVELRNSRTSHWGIATRLKQSASPNGKKPEADEVMVYHLIHSPANRGQVGQYTIEEFWKPDCRIRINNTTNGMSLYGTNRTIPRADVLDNAFTAHMSTSLKWQTCSDFIRWSCEEKENSSRSLSKADVTACH